MKGEIACILLGPTSICCSTCWRLKESCQDSLYPTAANHRSEKDSAAHLSPSMYDLIVYSRSPNLGPRAKSTLQNIFYLAGGEAVPQQSAEGDKYSADPLGFCSRAPREYRGDHLNALIYGAILMVKCLATPASICWATVKDLELPEWEF